MRTRGSRAVTKLLIVGVMVGAAFGTSGCKKLLKKATQGADAGSTTATGTKAAGADDPDDQLQEKLDEYIKCLNSLSSSVHAAQKRYLTKIPKTGPKGNEGWADIYKLPDGAASKCATGVVKAKAMLPKNPALETAGEDFSKYASELDPMISQMDKYFENKDYRDDKWAKAKDMHPKLMAAWTNFNKADNQLHATLDGITKPLAQRMLSRIEREDGKRFAYHRKHVLNTGRELVEASDPAGEDATVDFNLLNAAYTEFEKSVDELSSYGGSHKADLTDQKKASHWPMADHNYDQFVDKANAFKKSTKEYLRCLRDAPAKAKTTAGKIDPEKIPTCPDGRVGEVADQVVKKYNEFIRTSNDSQFP